MTHNETALTAEQHFGAQVRDARDTRGWTQEALARHLFSTSGVSLSQTAITRLEQGKRPIRLNEASAIARLLGLDLTPFGGSLPLLSSEEYEHALGRVKKVREWERQAREALAHLREVHAEQAARAEREVESRREERQQLEAAIREYEDRQRG